MNYDFIIIGGGMVGAALACALRDTPLRIAMVDATTANIDDPRLIALNYSSCTLLKNLNVWSSLASHATAIHQVHVSYAGKFGTTRINAHELQLETLGHVIPAKFINSALYSALKNIDIYQPATLQNFSQHDDHVTVDILDQSQTKTLSGKILIGADGTHSTVRKLLNIATEMFDYEQSAIVTQTELNRAHGFIAYERFHQTGAIAMLPLINNCVATIWSDSNENVSRLMQLDDNDFLEKLQKDFGYRLGKLKKIHKRFVFPLQMIKAEKLINNRVILIGNAAHTLHPIAAQGLNLALYEVALLAENLRQENFSLSDLSFDTQQKSSLRLSHYLPKLFTSDFFLTNAARQLGLLGLDAILPAKKRFAKHALGMAGKIPELLSTH